MLYAVMNSDRGMLWSRRPVEQETTWDRVDRLLEPADRNAEIEVVPPQRVRAMTPVSGRLIAAPLNEKMLWIRNLNRKVLTLADRIWATLPSVPSGKVVALANANGDLFAATDENRLWINNTVWMSDLGCN